MQDIDRHIADSIARHRAFWQGTGPSLLLLPARLRDLYELDGYTQRFADPDLMLEHERERAIEIAAWPTDGIPTVRPNLGTVFVPETCGQDFSVPEGSMPWPGDVLDESAIRTGARRPMESSLLFGRAAAFYERAVADPRVYAYHADTQGVFDIAHILYGEEIFLDMATEDRRSWVRELMDLCLERYLEVSRRIKKLLDEPDTQMVHGHGTEQGIFFPDAGVRMSEDSATLVSPSMIEGDLFPFMEAAARPFGGAFVHYCGRHDELFRMLCRAPWCRAIDLGNPEFYELGMIFREASGSGTVLYTRLPARESETHMQYVERIGAAAAGAGVRLVLRSTLAPESRGQAEDMLGRFRELTAVG